jgi:hypothetical protein
VSQRVVEGNSNHAHRNADWHSEEAGTNTLGWRPGSLGQRWTARGALGWECRLRGNSGFPLSLRPGVSLEEVAGGSWERRDRDPVSARISCIQPGEEGGHKRNCSLWGRGLG